MPKKRRMRGVKARRNPKIDSVNPVIIFIIAKLRVKAGGCRKEKK